MNITNNPEINSASEELACYLDTIIDCEDIQKSKMMIAGILDNSAYISLLVSPSGKLSSKMLQLKQKPGCSRVINDLHRQIKRSSIPALRIAGDNEKIPDLNDILKDCLTFKLPEELYPPKDYRVKHREITWLKLDKDEDVQEIQVCNAPLLITAIYEDFRTKKQYLRLTWLSDYGWKTKVVSYKKCFESRNIVELSEFGAPITSNNSKMIIQYLTDYLTRNRTALPRVRSTARIGWVGDQLI